MDFRWKVPELKPNFVDPQGVRSTMAAQQMQGYAPNPQPNMGGYQPNVQPNVRGMAPSQAAQQNNAALAEQNYQQFVKDDAALQEKKQKLALLENKLAEIDNNIAQLQQGGSDEEKAIAAKLAEIGDTSLYQGILAREQNQAAQQKSSAAGIDNMLYEADKLTFGLDSKSEEERNAVRQNIRATLDRAEEIAKQTGTQLPEKYYRLRDKLEGSDKASIVYESERKRANEWWAKARNKTLTDKDIAEVRDFIERHPDSDAATKLRPLVEQYAPQTVESKAAASKRKQDARNLYDILSDLPKDELSRRARNLTASERKLLEDHYPEFLK